MTQTPENNPLKQLHAHHPRRWGDFHYVYPVLSRRSKGLSIGVNLNPDKVCNWDCVYCQVDRDVAPVRKDVDFEQVREELEWMVGWAAGGHCWEEEQFKDVPEYLKRVNDIAFSGDGEPTTYERFDEMCGLAVELKEKYGLGDTKIIVLSNMTMRHRAQVERGFGLIAKHEGEIWAKLDTGTQAYYELIDRSAVKRERVVGNILEEGKRQALVIQSLLMKIHGEAMGAEEFDAYCATLRDLLANGCQIKLVQLYTVARDTAEDYVSGLSDEELGEFAKRFEALLPGVKYETFGG